MSDDDKGLVEALAMSAAQGKLNSSTLQKAQQLGGWEEALAAAKNELPPRIAKVIALSTDRGRS